MRIAGNYTFAAPRAAVWDALNDPQVLARAIPGCQRLDQVGESEFDMTLKIGLQAVKGVYNGRITVADPDPPQTYRLLVDGKGSNGFMRGEGVVSLREEEGLTILDYGGEVQVGGTIASVGQRLLDGAAKTLINQSLKSLAAQIEARLAGATAPAAGPEAAPASAAAQLAPGAPVEAAALAAPTVAFHHPPATAPRPAATGSSDDPAVPRRSVVVPAHEQLTEIDVARGLLEDFFKERPWFPWVVAAFLLGYLFGRRT